MEREIVSRDRKWWAAAVVAKANNVQVGSAVPTKFPAWVTIEVGTGGFATGAALSALLHGETPSDELLRNPAKVEELLEHVDSGCFIVERAEDAILPVVVCLVRDGKDEAAKRILDRVGPYLPVLRMYPVLTDTPRVCPALDVSSKFTCADMFSYISGGSRTALTVNVRTHGRTTARRFEAAARNLLKWALFDLTDEIDRTYTASYVNPADNLTTGFATMSDRVRAFFQELPGEDAALRLPKKLTLPHSDRMRLAIMVARTLNVVVPPCVYGHIKKTSAPHVQAGRATMTRKKTTMQMEISEVLEKIRMRGDALEKKGDAERTETAGLPPRGGDPQTPAKKPGPKQTHTVRRPNAYNKGTRAKELKEVASLLAFETVRRRASGTDPHDTVTFSQFQRTLGISDKTIPFLHEEMFTEHILPMIKEAEAVLASAEDVKSVTALKKRCSGARVRAVITTLPMTLREHVSQAKTITSADALTRALLVQLHHAEANPSSTVLPPRFADLFARILHAFSGRRSLLLRNFERQTTVDDLPWVIEMRKAFAHTPDTKRFKEVPHDTTLDPVSAFLDPAPVSPEQLKAQAALCPIVTALFTYFGGAMVPNVLVRELRAPYTKANAQGHELMSELAQDIFMGSFVPSYHRNAKHVAQLFAGTAYDRFYGLIQLNEFMTSKTCPWGPGQRIEGMQVCTTHNIVQLFEVCRRELLAPMQTYHELDARALALHEKFSPPTNALHAAESGKGLGDATHDRNRDARRAADGRRAEATTPVRRAYVSQAVDDPRVCLSRAGYRASVEVICEEMARMLTTETAYHRALCRRRLATGVRQMLAFYALRELFLETRVASEHVSSEVKHDVTAFENICQRHRASSNPALERPAMVVAGLISRLKRVMCNGETVHEGFFGWL